MVRNSFDCPDRLPQNMIVRDFDLFCFVFSAATYVIDVFSDATVAYVHYREGRIWAFIFIALLAILPSVLLNIVSLLWWMDDISACEIKPKKKDADQLLFRILICILQLGPVVWYLEAALAALKFRAANNADDKQKFYRKMVEFERDASLLRFFEAFLESAPQMLVQGLVLAHGFYFLNPSGKLPKWIYLQIASLSFSLLSSCWSFVIQHRSLRISRADKENITPFAAFLQLMWRVLTVFSRYMCFVFFMLAFNYWILVLIGVHYMISLLHVVALQPINTGIKNKPLEAGLVVICAAVHIFAPFNMAEGATRLRYIIAYAIEAVENSMMLFLVLSYDYFDYPYKKTVVFAAYAAFWLGIIIMLIYYAYFHPNCTKVAQDSLIMDAASPEFSVQEQMNTQFLIKNLKHVDSDWSINS